MIRQFVATFALGAALYPSLLAAQTSPPCDITATTKGVGRIEIDARTGRVTGDKRFARTSAAEIVIRNKNPFRYTYKLDVKEEVIPEPGLAAFLPFISPIALEDAEEGGDDGASASPTAIDRCPNLDPLSTTHASLLRSRTDIEKAIEDTATALKKTTASYTEAKETLESPSSDCVTIAATATKTRTELTSFLPTIDIAALEKAVNGLESDAKLQIAAIKKYRTANRDCPEDKTAGFLDRAELLSDSVPAKLRENIAKLSKVKQTLADALTRINKVLDAGPMAFTQYSRIGDYDEATMVTVSLDRKDMLVTDAKFEQIAASKFYFGGPAWFTIAGGAAGSSIGQTSYERIQGFPVDREGKPDGTELATVVGEKEDSSSRITPLLMLHGRLYDSGARIPATLQFSLGVSAKTDNESTDIEYLVGPSVGLLDNKLFLTVGAYGGRVQTLQGNLFVGGKVPATLTEIPVRKDLKWQLGFAVTYKIK